MVVSTVNRKSMEFHLQGSSKSFLNALRNSKLKMVYMTGLTQLLMYPSHVVSKKIVTPGRQVSLCSLMQMASRMLQVKNGTQQIRNTPIT
ncbi:hypothetical protein CEXT_753681 [Caerostris extrusa]|uniref:Uncharacterized protein n=1 Tax=Caerostris extrusa TaxID=172846 RepID=A0AAV4NL21_CAEEX|nr:hypothetical protein CEXT_753681 [Caerostris extrusa]